ncbi:hypothetical protein Tco_0839336 [Tanacetum coccineum]|uniref:Uncharacterized protein n=1 Tax=Tanacetum coccineum TaxID=301880 RepID=A0ABQ5AUU8_9ASTR
MMMRSKLFFRTVCRFYCIHYYYCTPADYDLTLYCHNLLEQESTSKSGLEELPEDVCAINAKFVGCSSSAWELYILLVKGTGVLCGRSKEGSGRQDKIAYDQLSFTFLEPHQATSYLILRLEWWCPDGSCNFSAWPVYQRVLTVVVKIKWVREWGRAELEGLLRGWSEGKEGGGWARRRAWCVAIRALCCVNPVESTGREGMLVLRKVPCDFVGASLLTRNPQQEVVNFLARGLVEFMGILLWIQNQMLDYGFNFMNTEIYIDNESTICIVKNPVFHSKTKHIEIRHYFIRDSYEKKLIQVIKIHIDHNVADLLTKTFLLLALDYSIFEAKIYETVYKEWEDKMERDATTASSLDAEQSYDPPLSRVYILGSGEDRDENIRTDGLCINCQIWVKDHQSQLWSHHTPQPTHPPYNLQLSIPSRVPTPPHDSPLPGGHTPRSDEGRM